MAASFEGLSVEMRCLLRFINYGIHSHDPVSCFIELILPRLECK